MTALAWDKVGDRVFQTGIDRGVLYLPDKIVPWNGLISVDEESNQESKEVYMDGTKYLERVSPGDYSATLKAFTYPKEFEEVLGNAPATVPGVVVYDQSPKSFNLSYRTKVGNDLDGTDHGYRIHLLYDLMAVPDTRSFQTLDSSAKPVEFSWKLSATPSHIDGRRPTSHVSFDSVDMDPNVLATIEEVIYGKSDTDPELPPFWLLAAYLGVLVVSTKGDGTVTLIDRDDQYIVASGVTGGWRVTADWTFNPVKGTWKIDKKGL